MSATTLTSQGVFMNKKIIFSSLLICLLAFAAILACGQDSSNARWEYKSISFSSDEFTKRANALGMEGWEFIQRDSGIGLYFFKRRLK